MHADQSREWNSRSARDRRNEDDATSPSVDVVIPARNEERDIVDCIRSIAAQRYPSTSVRVIVVDNGSTDRTQALLRAEGITDITQVSGRVGAVRNAGAALGSAPIIAFLDADCVAGPEWVSAAVDLLRDEKVGAVGGAYLVRDGCTWVESTWSTTLPTEPRLTTALPGGSFIVRRDLFEKIGGFDPDLIAGEDDELSTRIRREGRELLLTADCYVIHLGTPRSLREVVSRQRWHGSSQLDVGGFRDKLVLLTHLFLLGTFALLTAIASRQNWLIVLSIFALLVPPILLTARRVGANEGVFSAPLYLLKTVAVGYAFFVGRSLGLLSNYFSRISRARPRKLEAQ